MMYQKQSNRWKLLKALCLIPVSGLALNVFATLETSVMQLPVQMYAPKDSVYGIAEEMPQYPGGEEALMVDLRKTVQYPKEARELGVKGVVSVFFVVRKNGKLDDFTVRGPSVSGVAGAQKGEEAVEAWLEYFRKEAQKQDKTLTTKEEKQYRAAVSSLQKEAVRALKALPGKWTPGRNGGEAVSVRLIIPIVFRLQ